jgi:hypothetical protein
MFHVKKVTPTRAVEVSKKRVILYEPQGDNKLTEQEMSDGLRHGVMQTIVDNSVKQPTTYRMEIIVPFQPIGRYITDGIKTLTDTITGIGDLTGGVMGGFSTVWETIFSTVFSSLKTINTVADVVGKLPGMDGASYINMNSLEAMADSCRVLCMKMWTGYDYKFAMITGMTHDKQPNEDGIFRAALTLQEIPVLAVTRPANPKAPAISRNGAVTAISAVQGALVAPLIEWTGVNGEDAAGGGKSGKDMLKSMLGIGN